jgi:hypothetical protein
MNQRVGGSTPSPVLGGLIMALGRIIELVLGIKVEGKSQETVNKPLTPAAT